VSVRPTLWILGAGGHGRVVADAAAASAKFAEIVFFDDAATLAPTSPSAPSAPSAPRVARWPLRGDTEAFFAQPTGAATSIERHIAIGDNGVRDRLVRRCEASQLKLATVVHPAAVVSADATVGAGAFIAAAAVVAPGADIGIAAIVNHGASVDHDNRIGRAVHIGPGAHLGGNVTVGETSWIGLGAALRHGVRVGRAALVGAGAVVVADVTDAARVVGNPARPLTDPAHAADTVDTAGGAAPAAHEPPRAPRQT
jgi:sugar O-acyltransferase (sialic acid O-acetyltransferase NeuD family)